MKLKDLLTEWDYTSKLPDGQWDLDFFTSLMSSDGWGIDKDEAKAFQEEWNSDHTEVAEVLKSGGMEFLGQEYNAIDAMCEKIHGGLSLEEVGISKEDGDAFFNMVKNDPESAIKKYTVKGPSEEDADVYISDGRENREYWSDKGHPSMTSAERNRR